MYIFLDYDGTIIKNSEDEFMKFYFSELSKKSGLPFETIYKIVMETTMETIKNQTHNKLLFDTFLDIITLKDKYDKTFWTNLFFDFYQNEFDKIKNIITPNDKLIKKIKMTKQKLIFASNPLFPKIATEKRIIFAGLSPENFYYIAHMENSHFAKPNPLFFKEILEKINAKPEECIMIGDSDFDKACEKIGIKFIHVANHEEWEGIF
ncbi:MAG: HAD family hydrolase [Thermosipho sp. (in: Bacteria)]|nr:HAD family hydrolase [Thermosipho sp. (in: thermotogales)]